MAIQDEFLRRFPHKKDISYVFKFHPTHLTFAGYPIGKRYVQIMPRWSSTYAIGAAAGFVLMAFICDWRYVLKHVPYVKERYRYPINEDKIVYIDPRISYKDI